MLGMFLFLIMLLIIAVIFLIETWSYNYIVAMIPRLYLFMIIGLVLIEIINIVKKEKIFTKLKEKINLKSISVNKKVLMLLAISSIYIIAIEFLGFYLSTVLVIIGCSYLLGSKNIFYQLAASAGIVGFIYFFFNIILKIMLPSGIIWGGM